MFCPICHRLRLPGAAARPVVYSGRLVPRSTIKQKYQMNMPAVVAPPGADPVDALIKSIRIPPRPSLLADLQRELASARAVAGGHRAHHRQRCRHGRRAAEAGQFLVLRRQAPGQVDRPGHRFPRHQPGGGADDRPAGAPGDRRRQRRAGRRSGTCRPAARRRWCSCRASCASARPTSPTPSACSATPAWRCCWTRFPDYAATFEAAGGATDRRFTDIEDERHGTNHVGDRLPAGAQLGLVERRRVGDPAPPRLPA